LSNPYRKANPLLTKTGKERLKPLSIKQLQEKIQANVRPNRTDKMRKELARKLKMNIVYKENEAVEQDA